jgi:hypothetical protein
MSSHKGVQFHDGVRINRILHMSLAVTELLIRVPLYAKHENLIETEFVQVHRLCKFQPLRDNDAQTIRTTQLHDTSRWCFPDRSGRIVRTD